MAWIRQRVRWSFAAFLNDCLNHEVYENGFNVYDSATKALGTIQKKYRDVPSIQIQFPLVARLCKQEDKDIRRILLYSLQYLGF